MEPDIIQGGMGIAVSSWKLAREVATHGALGVVSGTAIDSVIARRLQDGDADGSIRKAMRHFPNQQIVHEILEMYFIEGGKAQGLPYTLLPKITVAPTCFATNLIVVSTFIEVWLAKEGHSGLVGINALQKIQMAIPAQIYGAILAEVDYILMGAGIPSEVPSIIRDLSQNKVITLPIDVASAKSKHFLKFDPHLIASLPHSPRLPKFLAIISSHALAAYLSRDDTTRPDGFVVEGFNAGGHNAPPRSKDSMGEDGQSKFTDIDSADLSKVAKTGLPFWLAGGYGTPLGLAEAKKLGAVGIQVGSLFALAKESGLTDELRKKVTDLVVQDSMKVRTDPFASPTGFPFKIVQLDGTLSESELFRERNRLCDLGYLRVPFERTNGSLGYRCPAEPLKTYTFKKGESKNAPVAHCLCNALMADVGLGQTRPDGYKELPMLTLGSDLAGIKALSELHVAGWNSRDVLDFLRS
ncbi:MAG: nitronate monooxygenase [Actinobacteria bacterium]|nr:nitronate monooxygenase [Actinomycetota bacterium]